MPEVDRSANRQQSLFSVSFLSVLLPKRETCHRLAMTVNASLGSLRTGHALTLEWSSLAIISDKDARFSHEIVAQLER